jgi:organic radical activating enzyme
MIFITGELEYQQLLAKGHAVLKVNYEGTDLVDAWMAERPGGPAAGKYPVSDPGVVYLRPTDNGLFGHLEMEVRDDLSAMEECTRIAYQRIFEQLTAYPELQVIRYWNYVPMITASTEEGTPVYQLFNAGRYRAFQQQYGAGLDQIAVPAASAVGTSEPGLRIEFFAVSTPLASIENKDQVPAYRYSARYGSIPPFFSRGAIFDNHGQRILLSSGTASVAGEDSRHPGDLYEQICQSIHNLRILGSQFNLKRYDIHYGFALEDIRLLRVYYKRPEDRGTLERFIPKFLAPGTRISFMPANICRAELLVELEALFVKKGESESGDQPKYRLNGQRIRTESFEIHVAEHCNLKCRDCCNISPFNAKKFVSPEEVADICDFVQTRFVPDVFKIAGGEPTLHPKLDEILKIVRRSCPGTVIRVITNGLLLHRMSAAFWENIDQLTVSNYISAPVKPKLLDEIRQKARQYEIVLNIKFVDEFNEIFVDDRIEDRAKVQEIYDDCWMRHRCHIVRNGRFYKCTRAAYMNDFLRLKGISPAAGDSTYSVEDGVALNDDDFRDKVLHYLNDDQPLHSCDYCLGVSGGLRENIQLK